MAVQLTEMQLNQYTTVH